MLKYAETVLAIIASALTVLFPKPSVAQDLDQDGLDDAFEDSLLEKLRPFFAFVGNETFRPTDVKIYIQNSNLLKSGDQNQSLLIDVNTLRASPDGVLTANLKGKNFCSNTLPGPGSTQTCVSNLFVNRRQTDYRIIPSPIRPVRRRTIRRGTGKNGPKSLSRRISDFLATSSRCICKIHCLTVTRAGRLFRNLNQRHFLSRSSIGSASATTVMMSLLTSAIMKAIGPRCSCCSSRFREMAVGHQAQQSCPS